jgi:uncharacterized membrane protein HdeD (DUF308 family)
MSTPTIAMNELLDGETARNFKGWVIFAGVTLLILGGASLIYDNTATIVSVVFFGSLLFLAGLIQMVQAIEVRAWSGFFLFLLDGVLRAAIGAFLVLYPESGAPAITLVLSVYFMVGGAFKTIASMMFQLPGWAWSAMSGLIAITLGAILALQWPSSGAWFIGVAVGVDLICNGWALLMFASLLQRLTPSKA